MKKIILFGLFFIYINGYSQNYFFVDKKGVKTIIKDDSFDLEIVGERIQYVPDGKNWEKFIKFKDLDYGLFGPYYFKSFKLINAKGRNIKETAFFVLAETKERKLLSYTYSVITRLNSIEYYEIYVVDNNNNILDYVKVNTSGMYANARAKILPFINKHFSDCKTIMDEVSNYEDTDEKHLNILGFFDNQRYRKCE
jgi:hypothetical protein